MVLTADKVARCNTFQGTVKRLTLHTDYSPVTDSMVLAAHKVAGCNTFQGTVKFLPFIRLIALGSDSMVLDQTG